MSFSNRPRRFVLRSPNGSRIELDADEATIKMYGKNGVLLAILDAALEVAGDSIYVHQVFDYLGNLVAQFGGLVIKVVGLDGTAALSAGSSSDAASLPKLELTVPSNTVPAIVEAEDVANNGANLTIRTPTYTTHNPATIVLKAETDLAQPRIEITADFTLFTGDVQCADLAATGNITGVSITGSGNIQGVDIHATDDITAAGDITATGAVSGATVAATGAVTSNGVSLSDPPGAQLRATTQQGCTNNAFTGLIFNTEDYDNQNGHNNVTNNTRYTFQVAGRYNLSGKVAFVSNTNGRRITLWRLNGVTTVPGSQISRAVGAGADEKGFDAANISVLVGVGDYVELMVYQDSGSNPLNTSVGDAGTQPFMQVTRIGSA